MKNKIEKELQMQIYKDFEAGIEMSELKAKYGLSAAKIRNYVVQQQEETFAPEQAMKASKQTTRIADLSPAKLDKLNKMLDEGRDSYEMSFIKICNDFNIAAGDLVNYYMENFESNEYFLTHYNELKAEYFAGATISQMHDKYEFFVRAHAEIFDRDAILEDFRSGMTMSELLKIYGDKDIDDLSFDFNENVDIGRRYSKIQILQIIVSELWRD